LIPCLIECGSHYANEHSHSLGNNPSNSGSSQTYSETLNNIPVQVQYDKDKYYVSGFEELLPVALALKNNNNANSNESKPLNQLFWEAFLICV
jgi:YbbR domain-containing protein